MLRGEEAGDIPAGVRLREGGCFGRVGGGRGPGRRARTSARA